MSERLELGVVVAIAHGGVIGFQGKLPWERIPQDLKHFKEVTMGHAIIMGRKTHESIGRVLPGRENIVITTTPRLVLDGAKSATHFKEAVEKARAFSSKMPMVVGGAQVYAEAMDVATHLFLTKINQQVEGDRRFTFNPDEWVEQPETRRELAPGVVFVEHQRRT